jgi:hypothetical protein
MPTFVRIADISADPTRGTQYQARRSTQEGGGPPARRDKFALNHRASAFGSRAAFLARPSNPRDRRSQGSDAVRSRSARRRSVHA